MWSNRPTYAPTKIETTITSNVYVTVCFRVGQLTCFISPFTSLKKLKILICFWSFLKPLPGSCVNNILLLKRLVKRLFFNQILKQAQNSHGSYPARYGGNILYNFRNLLKIHITLQKFSCRSNSYINYSLSL
ncbi:MAG: hypothetical protein RLZZ517_170 [Candidatus Parcubacteria bacterium]